MVDPARVRKPRDKAKAEAGVLLVERWILARLRKHTFFSLAELNREIQRLLQDLNNNAFKKLAGSRKSRYEELDRPALKALADCQWIKEHNNLLITDSTGAGKSFLACVFAQKACRQGHTALYLRMSKLFEDMALAKGDGRCLKLLTTLAKTDLLVFDDFGLAPLNQEQRHDLLKILGDRNSSNQHL